jgi:hypothetical protein
VIARVVVGLLGVLGSAVYAADLQVEVRVDVMRGCQLIGQQREAGIEQLGVLDFGSTARLDDPAGPLGAALTNHGCHAWSATPTHLISCVSTVACMAASVRFATWRGGREQADSVPPVQDAARRVPLVVDVPVSGRCRTAAPWSCRCMRIERLAQVPQVGRYSDLVKVTVTW